MKKVLILTTPLFIAASAFAQITVNFDSETEYTGNFSALSSGEVLSTWNSGNGVGGVSGFLDVGSQTGAYYNSGLTKTAGTIYESSYMIKIGTPASDINDYRLGFVRSTGSNFGGGGDSVNAYLRSDGGVSTYTIELFGDSVSTGLETAQFSLTADTWYQFSVQMTLNSETSVDFSSALYNVGANGTSSPSLVSGSSISTSSSISLVAGGGFNGTDVFAGFTTRNNTGSVGQGMDNFSLAVVPEPSTFAFISGFLALGLVMYRRRRS